MNAPWKPTDAANRDAFHAYVNDQYSQDVIRTVMVEHGWPLEKVHMGGLRNAVQSLSVTASPAILFVDLSEADDPLAEINGLAEVCEPGTVVIACGHVNDVRLYRDLLSSGLSDYLLKPLNADHVRDAIANAQASFLAPRADSGVERPHITISVIGTRGGVGASTVATSLAWQFSEQDKRSTALLDLDVHFGTGALALDLEPGRGLTDAIENPGRIDPLFIERAMVRANDNLAILSAEAPVSQPIMTDGAAYFHLQEELRNVFDYTIVDMPRSVMIQHPHLVQEPGTILVVTEFTLAAARDTIRILSWLKSNSPQSRIFIVANKCQPAVQEISRKDFEQSIERKIDLIIPFDGKAASQAAKLGKAIIEAAKATKLGQALTQIGTLVAEDDTAGDEPNGKKGKKGKGGAAKGGDGASLLGKLGGLKSLLPAKGKGAGAPGA